MLKRALSLLVMELPSTSHIIVLVLAGVLSGVVNTLAGGGALLLLPLLMFIGLPPHVANGTARIAVLAQGIAGVVGFYRAKQTPSRVAGRFAVPIVLGAIFGVGLAERISGEALYGVIGIALCVWSLVIVMRKEALRPPNGPQCRAWIRLLAAGFVGFYGGFLQAGVGFPLLALLVLLAAVPLPQANVDKVALVSLYTACVAVPGYAWAGHIAWAEGIILAAGASVGGYLGVRLQLRFGLRLIRLVLIVMVALSGLAMVVRALRHIS